MPIRSSEWLFSSLLKTCHDKTKVLVDGSPAAIACCRILAPTVNLGGSVIAYFECVKNIGVINDRSFSFKEYMEAVSESSTYCMLFLRTVDIFASQL